MRTFSKSSKLDNVCYDIRGPVMDEANEMIAKGEKIFKLNIGNPAPFAFNAPDEIIQAMTDNLRNAQGYLHRKRCFRAYHNGNAGSSQQRRRGACSCP